MRTHSLAALLVSAAAGLACGGDSSAQPPAGAAGGEPPPLAVSVHRVEPAPIAERLATTGTLRANEQVELVAEIAGEVEEILFREGTRVAKDAVLVRIDRRRVSAERARAFHRVQLAELLEKRQQELLADGLVSQSEYDAALSELNVLRAELALAEAQLEKSEIRAPFAGMIGLRAISPGTFLAAQQPIATLQDLDPIKLDFSLPEAYGGVVLVGDTVSFRVRGVEERLTATVIAIEPQVDQETRSIIYRARAGNPQQRLVPGAFADVEVAVRSVADALQVPTIAVIPELGGKKVFVVREGRAQPVAVETGIRSPQMIEVTSGLEAGDEVIVTAIDRLRPGLAVVVEGRS